MIAKNFGKHKLYTKRKAVTQKVQLQFPENLSIFRHYRLFFHDDVVIHQVFQNVSYLLNVSFSIIALKNVDFLDSVCGRRHHFKSVQRRRYSHLELETLIIRRIWIKITIQCEFSAL